MTGKQLLLKVKAQLNQLDTASNRTVRPEMVLLFVNDVYTKLVRAKYADNGGQVDTTAFQFTQLTTDELNYLTVPKEVTPAFDENNSEYFVEMSEFDNYWVHLRSKIKVKSDSVEKWMSNPNYKTLDTIGPALADPFNTPEFNDPILYFEDNKIKFPVSGFEVSKYSMTYLRKPAPIAYSDDELGIPFEDEIIDGAAYKILASWGDNRVSSDMTVNKILKSE